MTKGSFLHRFLVFSFFLLWLLAPNTALARAKTGDTDSIECIKNLSGLPSSHSQLASTSVKDLILESSFETDPDSVGVQVKRKDSPARNFFTDLKSFFETQIPLLRGLNFRVVVGPNAGDTYSQDKREVNVTTGSLRKKATKNDALSFSAKVGIAHELGHAVFESILLRESSGPLLYLVVTDTRQKWFEENLNQEDFNELSKKIMDLESKLGKSAPLFLHETVSSGMIFKEFMSAFEELGADLCTWVALNQPDLGLGERNFDLESRLDWQFNSSDAHHVLNKARRYIFQTYLKDKLLSPAGRLTLFRKISSAIIYAMEDCLNSQNWGEYPLQPVQAKKINFQVMRSIKSYMDKNTNY